MSIITYCKGKRKCVVYIEWTKMFAFLAAKLAMQLQIAKQLY